MTLNREEEEKYMRRNPRRGVVSSSGVAASSPWEEEYGKPMILPEAKPIGSYPMTDLEKRTLELRADPAAKDDLERAIHLAMERATIPINGSVGKTVVSKEVGKEEEEEEEDLKRAAAHSRKLVALQNRDFRSVENVAEIRESAARVKTWFRALGVELNENVLVSARDDDENETDTFARAVTKAATDGSLLKEIVESESKVRIPSSVFAASSSITEGGLTPGTVRKCFKTPSVIDEEAAKTLDGMRTFDSDSTISFNKLPSVAALVTALANVSVSFSSSSLADTNTFSLSSTPSARNHVFTLAALSLISATFSTLLKSLFCNATSFLL
jgi:hypothetical protein